MSSSRTRLYLDLKLSSPELSRRKKLPYGRFLRYKLNPAKYLKEITSKWSIFEKPYLDSDSPRAMNFRMPVPDWPSDPPRAPGFFPPDPGLWIFRFAPGICWISGGGSPECGDTIRLNLQLGLVPPGQYSGLDWTVSSSREEVRIIEISERGFGVSASVHLEIADEYEGPATICAGGYLKGRAISELVVMNPFPGLTGYLRYEEAMALPAAFQVSTSYYEHYIYDCGCVELDIECDLCEEPYVAWDWAASDQTIGQSDTASVAVKDGDPPYDWTVSGSGFSLSLAQTSGLGNTLISDATACGTASISVTDACGNSASGSVRGTEGSHWVYKSTVCELAGYQATGTTALSGIQYTAEAIYGGKKQFTNCSYVSTTSDSHYCMPHDFYAAVLELIGCPGPIAPAGGCCIAFDPPCVAMGYVCQCEKSIHCCHGHCEPIPGCEPPVPDICYAYRPNFNCTGTQYFEWECV